MKKNLIYWGLGLAILTATSIEVFAQPQFERYPTAAEIQNLRERFRQFLRSSGDREVFEAIRTDPKDQRREAFVRAWLRADPAAAPFLGTWNGSEEGLSIYPSNTRGRVCLIYIAPQDLELDIGTASNGQIQMNDGSVLFQEGNFLLSARVTNNQADIGSLDSPIHSPTILRSARQFAQLSAVNASEVNRVVQEFNAAGCTSGLPSRR